MQLPSLLVERPLFALAFGLTLLISVGNLVAMAYWARLEAARREVSTLRVLVYFVTFYGLLHYLYARLLRDSPEDRPFPATPRERLVATYTAAVAVGVLAAAVLAPPDPFTQVLYVPPSVAAAFAATRCWVTRVRPAVSRTAS